MWATLPKRTRTRFNLRSDHLKPVFCPRRWHTCLCLQKWGVRERSWAITIKHTAIHIIFSNKRSLYVFMIFAGEGGGFTGGGTSSRKTSSINLRARRHDSHRLRSKGDRQFELFIVVATAMLLSLPAWWARQAGMCTVNHAEHTFPNKSRPQRWTCWFGESREPTYSRRDRFHILPTGAAKGHYLCTLNCVSLKWLSENAAVGSEYYKYGTAVK